MARRGSYLVGQGRRVHGIVGCDRELLIVRLVVHDLGLDATGRGRGVTRDSSVQTSMPQLMGGAKSRAGGGSPVRARDSGSGAEGTRPRTCACCRLEFTTLPYSSSEYSNSESPISPEAPRDLVTREVVLFFR